MARVPVIDPEDADGRLAEVYDEIREARGLVANVYRVHSLLPDTMLGHKELYMSLLYGRGGLGRPHREMIAVAVSAANRCAYCVRHHGDALHRYWDDRARVDALADAVRDADPAARGLDDPALRDALDDLDLDATQRALVGFARDVALHHDAVEDADVDALRAAGLDDAQVLDATLVASYFCFVNRVVTTLDVDVEATTDDPRYAY